SAAGFGETFVQPFAVNVHAMGREEYRKPAVGDLGRERDVLRPDGGEIDRNVRPQRMNDQLERLAQPRTRSRRGVVMFGVVRPRPVALDDFTDDLDLLSR